MNDKIKTAEEILEGTLSIEMIAALSSIPKFKQWIVDAMEYHSSQFNPKANCGVQELINELKETSEKCLPEFKIGIQHAIMRASAYIENQPKAVEVEKLRDAFFSKFGFDENTEEEWQWIQDNCLSQANEGYLKKQMRAPIAKTFTLEEFNTYSHELGKKEVSDDEIDTERRKRDFLEAIEDNAFIVGKTSAYK